MEYKYSYLLNDGDNDNGSNSGGAVKIESSDEYYYLDPFRPLEDNPVVALLKQWNLLELCETFQDHQIDLECLAQITVSDIDALIPIDSLHLRIKFKANLAKWRIDKGYPSESIAEMLSRSTHYNPQNENLAKVPERSPVASTSSSRTDNSESMKVENMDIEAMLSMYTRGKNILRAADSEAKPLSSFQRKELILIICDYCIEKNISLGTENCEKLSVKIQERFPQESKGSYFIKANESGRARGPLYTCYNNRIKYLRKTGVLKPHKKRCHELRSPLKSSQSDVKIVDGVNDKTWLSYNSEPWGVVEAKWKSTFSVRRMEILSKSSSDVFVEWPLLRQSKALCLVDLDFVCMNKEETSFYLKEKWNIFSEKLLEMSAAKARVNKNLTDLVQRAKDEDLPKDEKDLTIFHILHHMIPSAQKIKIKENETKERYWHTSTKDSVDSCILKVSNQADILVQYKKLQDAYKTLGISLQPIIVDCLSQYFLVIDNVVHKVDKFLSALDYLFKVFYVLNIDFPRQSKNIWNFLQVYFYEIKSQTLAPNVIALINELSY